MDIPLLEQYILLSALEEEYLRGLLIQSENLFKMEKLMMGTWRTVHY